MLAEEYTHGVEITERGRARWAERHRHRASGDRQDHLVARCLHSLLDASDS